MKNTILLVLASILLVQCISQKDIENLSNETLYPIGKNGKWGFANQEGDLVIDYKFDSVNFFFNGLAVVKLDNKFGYINQEGEWHIKPKFDFADNFYRNCTSVRAKDKGGWINRKGKKVKECFYVLEGGCVIVHPVNPEKYSVVKDGKYELIFKYYLVVNDSTAHEITDTSNLSLDAVEEFSSRCLLLKKDGQFGLYDVQQPRHYIFDFTDISELDKSEIDKSFFYEGIKFNYDQIRYQRYYENEVQYAEFKKNNKWGIINGLGHEILNPLYDSIKIKSGWQMALVEYENNSFGYKKFNGKEFFKRE